jgi:hypothetical protein
VTEVSPGQERTRSRRAALDQLLSWYAYEFWRFVHVQQEVARFGGTFIEFPPMQKGASFNLEAVKQQILEASQARGR